VLAGGRGGASINLAAVARLAEGIATLLLDDGLDLIELNPVVATSAGAVAVDAAARRCHV
jgi:succinyl-CoA synthetase beta subunit